MTKSAAYRLQDVSSLSPRLQRLLRVAGVCVVDFAIGGLFDVQRTNGLLAHLRHSDSVIDVATADHYLDVFLGYTLVYVALLLIVAAGGILYLLFHLTAPMPTRFRAVGATHHWPRFPTKLLVLTVLVSSSFTGGLVNHALTERRFTHDQVVSRVSKADVLAPWYAAATFYQDAFAVISLGLLLVWSAWLLAAWVLRSRLPRLGAH